jgi:molecular chaperone GrpE
MDEQLKENTKEDENNNENEGANAENKNKNEHGEKLKKCEEERDEYLKGWQRAKADFANYKKDEGKRFAELAKYAHATLLEELITVLDNFDMAIEAHKGACVDKGIYMIRAHLEDVLRKRGLERISISPPTPFDAATMEAIGEMESSEPEGAVVEEITAGYRLYDKVLRPARVKVSRGHQNPKHEIRNPKS